jgi:HD superfamily phosphohydrolase
MYLADKMLRAINQKYASPIVDSDSIILVRLAGLLHDVGHGPFSHASEYVFDSLSKEIEAVRDENPDLFRPSDPDELTGLDKVEGHEILSYFIVKSPAFEKMWKEIRSFYDNSKYKAAHLSNIELDDVARLIIGARPVHAPAYLSTTINGPFDADKLDYLVRDGYFSGLATAVDIDRLCVSLDLDNLHGGDGGEKTICVDMGGATVLEQMMFSKMILFSSVYHHQKVRASFDYLVRMLEKMKLRQITIDGQKLDSAAGFLYFDDNYLLDPHNFSDDIQQMALKLRDRSLPMRSLVIPPDGIEGGLSQVSFTMLRVEARNLELSIEKKLNLPPDSVFIDAPPNPHFDRTGHYSRVRIAKGYLEPLEKIFPTVGWVKSFAQFRHRTCVFAPLKKENVVAVEALKQFKKKGIKLNGALCSQLAKAPNSSDFD